MQSCEPQFTTWLKRRSAGMLLPLSALQGDFGIGQLGSAAHQFADLLADAGMRYWQICPMGPTKYGDSPYSAESSFAGNPYLIDLSVLPNLGLLSPEALEPLRAKGAHRVDYGALYQQVRPLLQKAFGRFKGSIEPYGDYEAFKAEHAFWLESYAAYRACKAHFNDRPWTEWPKCYHNWALFRESDLTETLAEAIEFECFVQYLFWGQLRELQKYLRRCGIHLIGDVPFFAGHDSADVWAWPEYFLLNADASMRFVSGAKPKDAKKSRRGQGQVWGDPLYDWKALKADNYTWWSRRLKHLLDECDVLRLDHFLAFHACWAIPKSTLNPYDGHWEPCDGLGLLETLAADLPHAKCIAEDFGVITEPVVQLRDKLNIPGIAILTAGLLDASADNGYLPHSYKEHLLAYSSTQDSETLLGLYRDGDKALQDRFRHYITQQGGTFAPSHPTSSYIEAMLSSAAELVIIPAQDWLELDNRARMNTPGTIEGNWTWRLSREHFEQLKSKSPSMKALLKKTGRS